jgi:hypothetical protein
MADRTSSAKVHLISDDDRITDRRPVINIKPAKQAKNDAT